MEREREIVCVRSCACVTMCGLEGLAGEPLGCSSALLCTEVIEACNRTYRLYVGAMDLNLGFHADKE